jgi:hypothetical protein
LFLFSEKADSEIPFNHNIIGFESKIVIFLQEWNKKAKARIPQTFTHNYPGAKTLIISPDNVENIITNFGDR